MSAPDSEHRASSPDPRRSLDMLRARLRAELPYLRRRWKIDQLGIFGSYVRGEETGDSDLDLLVTFTEKPDLFDYVALERHLEDLLGLSVDVGMTTELRPSFRDRVEQDVEYL